MAKRVFCQSKNVDQTLEKHADKWILVAVLASKNTTYQEGELDWRELYFERREKGGPDEG